MKGIQLERAEVDLVLPAPLPVGSPAAFYLHQTQAAFFRLLFQPGMGSILSSQLSSLTFCTPTSRFTAASSIAYTPWQRHSDASQVCNVLTSSISVHIPYTFLITEGSCSITARKLGSIINDISNRKSSLLSTRSTLHIFLRMTDSALWRDWIPIF